MTNLIRCIGKRAARPYDWEQADVRLYSIEELCFHIVRNRYLLGRDSFRSDLIDWIELELGLDDLATSLRRRVEKRCDVADFAFLILDYVRYNTPEEIEETKQVLKASTDMNVYDRHLARADFLIESGRFDQALDTYQSLRRSGVTDDMPAKARMFYNEGVMHAKMFNFTAAAASFRSAYELTHDPESYLRYLGALRMRMTEKEYLDYITEDAKGYQFSQTLERAIQEAEEAYAQSAENEVVKTLFTLKNEGKQGEYYQYAQQITDDLKRAYRGSMDAASRY